MNELSSDHLARVCSIYGYLRQANPSLRDLPANPLWIRWRYLPYERWKCYGVAQDSRLGVMVSINPLAFEEGWDLTLTGIINHELCHCMYPDIGHMDPFKDHEKGWEQYHAFRLELEMFREHARRIALDRSIIHIYYCDRCDTHIHLDRLLPAGTACKMCCIRVTKGQHSPLFALKYVGREGNCHGIPRDNHQQAQEAQQQGLEASNS